MASLLLIASVCVDQHKTQILDLISGKCGAVISNLLSFPKYWKKNLTHNSLYEQFQSGFPNHYSTETTLIKITNDLLMAVHFPRPEGGLRHNTHTILLNKLSSIGIIIILYWFHSYLSGRTQFILKSFKFPLSLLVCPRGQSWAPFVHHLLEIYLK